MDVIAASKPLLPLSILILAAGLSFLVVRWPQGRHATFSRHAAAQKATIYYYIALFAVTLPLLSVFFIAWFVPTLQLSYWFIVFALASELLQHAVTVIPEVGGWKTRWHGFLTGCSALLIVPMQVLVIGSSQVTPIGRTVAVVSLAIMVLIIAYQVFLADKKQPRNQLLLQTGYYGAFFASILFVTYHG